LLQQDYERSGTRGSAEKDISRRLIVDEALYALDETERVAADAKHTLTPSCPADFPTNFTLLF
jgi:hypothetical protein